MMSQASSTSSASATQARSNCGPLMTTPVSVERGSSPTFRFCRSPSAFRVDRSALSFEKNLREKAQRQFHRAILESFMVEHFEELQGLVDEHGPDSLQAQSKRRFIAQHIPVHASWAKGEAMARSSDLQKEPLTEAAACASLVANEQAGLSSEWIDLERRGYSRELISRLQEFLREHGFSHSLVSDSHPLQVKSASLDVGELAQATARQERLVDMAHVAMIGDRSSMEDVVLQESFRWGHLCLVADGHKDGGKIARVCCERFKAHLLEIVEGEKGVEITHVRIAWEQTLDDVREKQAEILKRMDVKSTREAIEKECLEDLEDIQWLLGGSVFAASIVLHSGELITLSHGDCAVKVLRNKDGSMVGMPISLARDFRHRKERRRVESWIARQTASLSMDAGSIESPHELLPPSSLPQEDDDEPIDSVDGQRAASPSNIVTAPFSVETSDQLSTHEVSPGHDAHAKFPSVDGEYVGQVHVRTLEEWGRWRDSLTPPHIHTKAGYSNTSRSVGDLWLEELTSGLLPIRAPKISCIRLNPGDIVITHSDGMDLSHQQVSELALKLASSDGSMKTLVRAIAKACINTHPIDLGEELMTQIPEHAAFQEKKEWISACLKWVTNAIEHAPELLGNASDVLPAPSLFQDNEEWNEAVSELIPHLVALARKLPESPAQSRLLEFFSLLGGKDQLTPEELLPVDTYLAHWQGLTDQRLDEFEKFIGFFPIGVELTGIMDEATALQTRELCQDYLLRWCSASRHDNLSVVALKVMPELQKPVSLACRA